MTEGVPRVPPPHERGGVKKESASVDEDKFKKLMKVEEVRETDSGEKKKQKRREEETEEETVKKAEAAGPVSKKAKAIEGLEEAPLARKKVAPKAIPTIPGAAPPTGKAPSVGAFKAEEIEAFAWEEEAEAAKAPFGAAPAAPIGPEVRRAKAEAPGPEITGETPKKFMGEKPPAAPPPPQPAPPQEPYAEPEKVLEGMVHNEEPPPPPTEKYAEEWPQTTAFRPSPAFRSLEVPSEPEIETERAPSLKRPSAAEEKEKGKERRKEAPAEKTGETAPAEKKRAAAKKAAAGAPGLPGKEGKPEPVKAFAEYMEEGEEKKPAAAKAAPKAEEAAAKGGAKAVPPIPPGAKPKAEMPQPPVPGAVKPGEVTPIAMPAKELPPELASAALQGILPPEETFPSLKKTAGTTISPEKAKKEEKEGEGLVSAMGALSEKEAGLGGEGGGEGGRKRREEEEEKAIPLTGAAAEMAAPLPHIEAPAPAAGASPYAQMSPQVLALFERMVGVMTIIQTTGVTETVMTLNARQFASSVLYGSQVVIREFSSAPTRFNVEFVGSPEALTLVQQNVPALMGAVQQGNFNFTINRFDVKLASTEKPIFTRKEALEEKGEGEEKEKERESP